MITLVDNFIDNFAGLRAAADVASFGSMNNPKDGVDYPNISLDIPEEYQVEIYCKLCELQDRQLDLHTMFMRMSPQGTAAPHQAHSDEAMGNYSAMLYLNRPEHCQGGTAFLEHSSGFFSGPLDELQHAMWKRDTNDEAAWNTIGLASMEANKLCMFPSNLMHRAEPVQGFGTSPIDARLVLTVFFS